MFDKKRKQNPVIDVSNSVGCEVSGNVLVDQTGRNIQLLGAKGAKGLRAHNNMAFYKKNMRIPDVNLAIDMAVAVATLASLLLTMHYAWHIF